MLARKSLFFLLTTLFIKGGEALVFIIAANKYTTNEFGYLTIAKSFFAFFIFFSDLNLNQTHIKKMAEATYQRNLYISTYFTFKMVLVPCVTLVFLSIIFLDPAPKPIILQQSLTVLLFSSTINSINLIFQGTFHAEMKVTQMQFGNVIGSAVRLILTFLIVIFIDGFIYFVLLYLFYEIFTLCINLILARHIRLTRVTKQILKEYLKFGGMFLVSDVMSVFYSNFGQIALADRLGVDAIGIYSNVSRMVTILNVIQVSFQAFLLPNISNNLKKNNIDEIKRKTELFQKYILVYWGISSITCLGLGVYLLKLLPIAYQEQGLLLLWCEVLYVINTAWIPYRVLLVSQEDPRYLLVTLTTLVASIFSWIFLSAPLGILSIEFGRYLAFIPNAAIPAYYAYKRFGFGKPLKSTMIIIAMVLCFVTAQLSFRLAFLPIAPAILLTSLLVGAFIVLLFLTHVLNRDDLSFFKRVLDPRKMVKDIKSDLAS
jgi:O-antigen/teichoic acid export membrane protein